MRRSPSTIAVLLLALLSVIRPAPLESAANTLRLFAADWCSLPFRALLPDTAEASGDGAQLSARRGLWADALAEERSQEQGLEAWVLRRDPKNHRLLIAAGARQGLRRGAAVSAEGCFIGIVEEVQADLARVRLASSERVRFAAAIVEEDELPLRFLLQGAWTGVARSLKGSMIPLRCRGRSLTSVGSELVPEGLLIGTVASDRDLGEVVVELAETRYRSVERLRVHGGPRGEADPEALFDRVDCRVLLANGRAGGAEALIDRGSASGLRRGDGVLHRGRLVGRISALGRWNARLELFSEDATVAAVEIRKSDQGGYSWRRCRARGRDLGQLFSYGGGHRIPPGQILAEVEMKGAEELTVLCFRAAEQWALLWGAGPQ